MQSMRSHYRCVCGRTYIDKLYIFDRVPEPPPPPPPLSPPSLPLPRSRFAINGTDKSSREDSSPHSTDATEHISKQDSSTQIWDELPSLEAKVEDDVKSATEITLTDDVVDKTPPPKIHSHGASSQDSKKEVASGNENSNDSSPHNSQEFLSRGSDTEVVSTSEVNKKTLSSNDLTDGDSNSDSLSQDKPQTQGVDPEVEYLDADVTSTLDRNVKAGSLNSNHGLSHSDHPPVEKETVENDNQSDDNGLSLSMASQIQSLQEDNQILLGKVAASQECQTFLKEENQRLAKHIEEMAGIDSHYDRADSSSTDTEKELEQFKRQYTFLNHELKIVREENFKLRQSESAFLSDRKYETSSNQIKKYKSREGIDEIVPSKNSISQVSGDLLESQEKDCIKINGYDENHNERQGPPQDKETQTLDPDAGQLERYKTTLSNIQNDVRDIKGRHGDLRVCCSNLKDDAGVFSKQMAAMMTDTNKQIMQAMSVITDQNEKWKQKYIREMKLRKKLQNQVVDLKGNIRVFCRIRPCIKEDNQENCDSDAGVRVIASPDTIDDGLIHIDNKGRQAEFDVDKVFGMWSSQEEIFEEVSPLVRSVIDGYNVCIFAYGQTGSGKTYTMEGPSVNPGINQRALQLLFEGLEQDGWVYTITASVLEIYNETIRDLLNSDVSNKLEVKLKPEGGLYVPGVVVVPVTSLQEVNTLSETGRQHRFTASTSMNDLSSRSHCLLCVTVQGHHTDTGINSTGRLNLVDLAGSERVGRSHADGVRLKEAQNINKSLACLGDVIHALRTKQGHVPYRNSKLTYLLQDSLGGDSKTLMIVQVSPAESNISETMCSLNFGQRVRSVETGQATKNVSKSSSRRPTNLNLLQTPTSPGSPLSPSSVFSSPTVTLSPSSPQTPSSPSPRQRRCIHVQPPPQQSSPLPSPSSPPKSRRFASSSSSSSSTPSSQLQSSSSSPKPRRSTVSSTLSSSSSSPSTPTSKLRKSMLSTSSGSASAPSSPSLRRSKSACSSSSRSSTSSSSTGRTAKTPPTSPSNSPTIRRKNTITRNSSFSSPARHTKSSLARSIITSPQNLLNPPPPTTNQRMSYLRPKNSTLAPTDNSKRGFLSSYPPVAGSSFKRKPNTKTPSSSEKTSQIPFRV